MYNRLQYISQGESVEEQLYNIHQALDNGCDWIQMRFKHQKPKKTFALAEAIKFLCEEYLANFIINDNVHLAKQINADGVHLGLSDMVVTEARAILGRTKIIGATANTFEDIIHQTENGCDYIGLGPFQFTKTKSKLSPILGLEGYRSIIAQMKQAQIETPVYAIGGITLGDVNALMNTGIHGIAVSGIITKSDDKLEIITQLNEKLYGNIIV
ncbi:thiamine phosphate synthase [Flavobacterium gilvum]|uniref:Thiamine-phosphate synthase n=1 Tax=Flavobacterium gilvum TaxID=1492737 RepID=A0AAC9I3U2_9FLAO|nr:thiamine phosphate synthase [Flavobacterium gilvum]AOW09120.1 thiamine-phosphate diphosphorylase [Flavobacterium gilvum]KFC60234.1 thiamine-phosphate pyrophosphorylase [Flavobacterium gilvum]